VTWQVRFTPRADDDVAEAYGWYEGSQRGLGAEFLEDVERALRLVQQVPEGCPDVHRGLRRALLHRFPYSLYYRPLEATETIEVRGCIHQRRHPRTWRRRA
jgi:plasmid stabilization system protein ParE